MGRRTFVSWQSLRAWDIKVFLNSFLQRTPNQITGNRCGWLCRLVEVIHPARKRASGPHCPLQ